MTSRAPLEIMTYSVAASAASVAASAALVAASAPPSETEAATHI